jgi:hypothetical protein
MLTALASGGRAAHEKTRVKELPPAYREIAPGVDLLAALLSHFAERGGYVHASGWVEEVELALPLADANVTRGYRGRFVLAQLSGPVGGPYGVTLSRAVNDGVETLAGMLVRARSAGVSACSVGTGFVRREGVDAAAAARPLVPVTTGRGSGFASRVLAGGPPPADDDEETQEPEPGDLVEHFAFGLCEVVRVSGDQLTLRDRKSGRIREVRHGFLTITGPVEHEGKRLFSLKRPG